MRESEKDQLKELEKKVDQKIIKRLRESENCG